MADEPVGHLAVGVDRGPVREAASYHGGALKTTSGGAGTVDVYDGFDATGELIDTFQAAASDVDVHIFERGLQLRSGIYVDLGSNVSAFTLYYIPGKR